MKLDTGYKYEAPENIYVFNNLLEGLNVCTGSWKLLDSQLTKD